MTLNPIEFFKFSSYICLFLIFIHIVDKTTKPQQIVKTFDSLFRDQIFDDDQIYLVQL